MHFFLLESDEQNVVVADYIGQTVHLARSNMGSNPIRGMDMLGDLVF
jgi:hypothetical protein